MRNEWNWHTHPHTLIKNFAPVIIPKGCLRSRALPFVWINQKPLGQRGVLPGSIVVKEKVTKRHPTPLGSNYCDSSVQAYRKHGAHTKKWPDYIVFMKCWGEDAFLLASCSSALSSMGSNNDSMRPPLPRPVNGTAPMLWRWCWSVEMVTTASLHQPRARRMG